ncbi:MAG: site-specific DNA-methyltransferase, partial [Cytophagales bacterium]|nr:site-specific DNA-methyltransferase [Cytophagales bacterium]
MAKKPTVSKTVETIKHEEAKRKIIPTAEYQSVLQKNEQDPVRVAYERRNKDLDPQLVWRGKDVQDWSDLVVHAPPLYIQEKVHPKALIDDLLRQTKEKEYASGQIMADLFADFNGVPKGVDKTEFYQHDQNWSNRMILGDSLQVMTSLAEREGLRGRVQTIFFDPPYGIKFNSNFQWSTTSRDVKDGKLDQITREPEQVKAFRDTWRDGVHSYLTYIRDRLTVARDLLSESGAFFLQINSENQHLMSNVLDEVFGSENLIANIVFRKKTLPLGAKYIETMHDHILFYGKDATKTKFRHLYAYATELTHHWKFIEKGYKDIITLSKSEQEALKIEKGLKLFRNFSLLAPSFSETEHVPFEFEGCKYPPPNNGAWVVSKEKRERIGKAGRFREEGKSLAYKLYHEDFPYRKLTNLWADHAVSFEKNYVVQTAPEIIQRCILMTTDPGDLVLDPTCGSGTTATVAEQWGRRWITIDTSRVALALARARIMGARYPFYLLADSKEGQIKEAEVTRTAPSSKPVYGNIRQGFVYERVPHITLKSIANNTEIDVIWEKWQVKLEPLRESLNTNLKASWQEWEIPREADAKWNDAIKALHEEWWKARIGRQQEIDKSIAAKAEFEYLYDKPYEDKKKVRVAGPFTVESLSPHRTLGVDENDELIDPLKVNEEKGRYGQDFHQMVLDNLKMAGVQQAHKEDKINFTSLVAWPGNLVSAEGHYLEGEKEKRAAIFIGPEFGTVQRADLVAAAREAGDAEFDVLIACAFNYEAHTTEFSKLGRIPVLKARMNADLHMSDELKNTGKGNLFVIFGEPDIDIIKAKDDKIQVKVNGVDVFHPNTGEVRSDGADGIACWFIDTDYNEESFFVRHAYFLGANDPYSSLKTTLKAEINQEAWESLHSDTSRPFPKPKTGRIAVKVINHLGDEVMKVF